MRPKRVQYKPELFEDIGKPLEAEHPPPPPPKVIGQAAQSWEPLLTPAQQILWESNSKFILCWSEKFSGKTVGATHKLVRHLYDNQNALAVVLVRVKSMANKGGAWDKLMNYVLPIWRDGNRDREGKLLDSGMGLNFTEIKFDAQHNEMVYVQNRYGGWSRAVFVSAPNSNQLRERIRGYEPSFVFVDELTSCDSNVYFTSIAAQIGRVMGIPLQQYVAACNPEGETHWVYQTWFVNPLNEATGERNPDYEEIYFPRSENIANVGDEYFNTLDNVYKDDPIEAARMIDGLWKDRIASDGLFSDVFNPTIHVRPVREDGGPDATKRLLPHPAYPMIMGLDPGAVFNAWVFCQWMPVDGRLRWVYFDEIAIFKKKVAYQTMVPVVMKRVRWWRDAVEAEMPLICISDASAFTYFRPGEGTYDVLDIQRVWENNRLRFNLESLKIKACPRFNGSMITRVRILQTALSQDEVIVSSGCKRIRAMLEGQRSEPQKMGMPFDPDKAMTPLRCDHIHVLDAATYPMLAASTQPSLLVAHRQNSAMMISAA
jgi:hypothetical protein